MLVGSVLSVLAMSLLVLGVLVWQEGGEWVGVLLTVGAVCAVTLVWWLRRRKSEGKAPLFDPDLFKSKLFSFGIRQSVLQNIALGGLLIALAHLPPARPRIQRPGGGALARPALADDVLRRRARGQEGGTPAPREPHPGGLRDPRPGRSRLDPAGPERGYEPSPRDPAHVLRSGHGPPGLAAQQLHAGPAVGGAGRRGRGRQFVDLVVRPVRRARVRRRDPLGGPLDHLHQQDRRERHPAARPKRSRSPRCWRTTLR